MTTSVLEAFSRCSPLFQALSDVHRQSIILLLSQHERLPVNAIADALPLSRPAVSHHLKVLKAAGLLELTRESRENYYRLTIESALDALQTLVDEARSSCG